MAINPAEITTVSVNQLVPADWNLSDLLPHEVAGLLKQGTVNGLADLISAYIGTVSSLAFNPTTVNSGETLPVTTITEWMFVGKGTFLNVGGGSDITTTEELNVLVSNGSYWSLAVEIPIDVEFSGVVQTIRSGFTQTVPSEDAVFKALELKLSTGGYSGTAQDIVNLINSFKTLQDGLEFTANGTDNFINIGVITKPTGAFLDSVLLRKGDWSFSGTTVTFTFTPILNAIIQFT